jgi:glycosyltransferase involved in cell wall biosynthesis
MLKVTIITVVYNRKNTILESLLSAWSQTYKNKEHIIIDGASTDGTLSIIEKAIQNSNFKNIKVISEKDNGIYDAINKGIRASTGDVISLLHSDDTYQSNTTIENVMAEFEKNIELDIIYGDSIYIDKNKKIIRKYDSSKFKVGSLEWGWMPSHTSMFISKRVFLLYGLYKTNYKIAADTEFIARIFKNNTIKFKYISKVLIKMRVGGISTSGFYNKLVLNLEFLRALKENQYKTNILKIISRYPRKILEIFNANNKS